MPVYRAVGFSVFAEARLYRAGLRSAQHRDRGIRLIGMHSRAGRAGHDTSAGRDQAQAFPRKSSKDISPFGRERPRGESSAGMREIGYVHRSGDFWVRFNIGLTFGKKLVQGPSVTFKT